uniref:Uncharacterized protein n=1 Tax=viral metagenome TaxID=1070528 RepID=A0A6C0KED2_9ZZZZ
MSHRSPPGHKKRTFTLKNVDIKVTNAKYGLVIISNIEKETSDSSKTTKIADLFISDVETSVSFLDENKKNYKCNVSMSDWNREKMLPEKTDIKCFWCKHSFSTKPIGCPITFCNSMIEKSYVSHITKDKYFMKENIGSKKLEMTKELSDIEIHPIKKDYYLTDGCFCSFNCTLAFIKDNNHNLFYKDSQSLLHSLYYQLIGKKVGKLLPSPHWRLLKDFGGNMSIQEYRQSFNVIDYEFMFSVRDMKEMRTISNVYKETI